MATNGCEPVSGVSKRVVFVREGRCDNALAIIASLKPACDVLSDRVCVWANE